MASAGQFDGQGAHHTPKPYVRQAFLKYLECGWLNHGFARAWCNDCGHDYFVACSCKGRCIGLSYNTLSRWKRQHTSAIIFPRLSGAAQVGRAALHIVAVAFIHCFGSSLNGHVHLHVLHPSQRYGLCLQRILAVDRPGTAFLRVRRGFLHELRDLPKGNTCLHAVEIPIHLNQARIGTNRISLCKQQHIAGQ